MNTVCDGCGARPAPIFSGRRALCATCAQKRTLPGPLPFLGAALAAAGLIAGSVLLAERLQGDDKERGGTSPLDELTKRFRGTPTLGNFSRDLTGVGARGQARSGHRPRRRNRTPGFDSRPPQQKQSRSGRRTGRRQDGDRRRFSSAHRGRQRSRFTARQTRSRTFARATGCRHEVSRRIRRTRQANSRRSQAQRARRRALHRRAAHARRSRRRRGRAWT